MFADLKPFTAIAWDFDDTLYGHRYSPLFWEFIASNPYAQVHHIITMRSHGWQDAIFTDLASEDSGLTRDHFRYLVSCPDALYEDFKRRSHASTILPTHDYYVFKGLFCRRMGADVLVDDMEDADISARGCEEHGIVHYHPDDLVPDGQVIIRNNDLIRKIRAAQPLGKTMSASAFLDWLETCR